MTTVGQAPSLDTLTDLASLDRGDVFSQKVGDWAYQHPLPSVHNEVQDAMGGFPTLPMDALIMAALEEDIKEKKSLPSAYLYDKALERVRDQVTDPIIKELLTEDIELRIWLQAKKLEAVYD